MKLSNLKAFQKHLNSAAPLHLCPVYVILAKDEHSQKIALDSVLDYILPSKVPAELSMTTLIADRLKAQDLVNELACLSLFSSKRALLLKSIDKLTKTHIEVLKEHFAHPPSALTLVMIGSSLPKDAAFYKKLEKLAILLDLTDQKPWDKEKEMVEWVHDYLKAEGKIIAPALAFRLVKAAGQEMTLLKNELNKILCYIGKRQEILAEDFLAIGALVTHYTVWQLASALLEKKGKDSLKIAEALLNEGTSLILLLRQLRSQIHMRCQYMSILESGGGITDISTTFPQVKLTHLNQQITQARFFGLHALENALLLIDEAELKAKNERINEHQLLEQLIIKILI